MTGGGSDGYDDGSSSPAVRRRGGEQQKSLSDRKNMKDDSKRHGERVPRPWTARSSDPPRGRKDVASSLEELRRAGGIGGGADASVDGEAVSAAGRLGRSSGGRSAVERGLVGVGESLLRSSSWSTVVSLPTLPSGLVGGEAVPALLSHLAGWWRDFACFVFSLRGVPVPVLVVVLRFHLLLFNGLLSGCCSYERPLCALRHSRRPVLKMRVLLRCRSCVFQSPYSSDSWARGLAHSSERANEGRVRAESTTVIYSVDLPLPATTSVLLYYCCAV